MFGLAQNIKYLSEVNIWGLGPETAWQKVAVVIVSDCPGKSNPNMLKVLEAMAVYQDGLAQAAINGEPVTAHIYKYTARSHMDENHRFWGGK
ncbi:chitin synthase, partial [Cladochytrium replicatum]